MSIPGKDGDGDGGITILIEIMAAILCPFRYLWARAVISTLIVSLMTELNETVYFYTEQKGQGLWRCEKRKSGRRLVRTVHTNDAYYFNVHITNCLTKV
jgi:hypothetical protein